MVVECTFIVLARDSAGDESDYTSQGAIDRTLRFR